MQDNCQICGTSSWKKLPDPVEGRAVTTAGRIVNESLGKSQCAKCGFVQRVNACFLGHTEYYERDYEKYYSRPGTTKFHLERYRVLVDWMVSALGRFAPATILDVGCGQGWAMEAMKIRYPKSRIEGVEPSICNGEVARRKGFAVYQTRAGGPRPADAKYDLVYSNNVIQHVTNTGEFVEFMKASVSDNGVLAITCPDASVPNIEILWADQNFSFLPAHLIGLCTDAEFSTIEWFASPPSPSVPPAQMLVLSRDAALRGNGMTPPVSGLKDIYQSKCEYLNSFKKIDDFICAQIQGCKRVFNLGASYWSSILAAYCPQYWQKVSACLVDDTDGIDPVFMDKQVLRLDTVSPMDDEAIVCGTSPATHKVLQARYSIWKHVISWDQFLSY